MTSLITNVLNHLSNTTVSALFSGAVGYLSSRVIKEIDPKVGLVCGLTSGALTGLFMADGSNVASRLICIAALLIIPFKACQRRELNVSPQIAAALSIGCAMITLIAAHILRAATEIDD